MIEYKGYIGVVEFDPEIDSFHGTVINKNDSSAFVRYIPQWFQAFIEPA